jgi:hypothetical protein
LFFDAWPFDSTSGGMGATPRKVQRTNALARSASRCDFSALRGKRLAEPPSNDQSASQLRFAAGIEVAHYRRLPAPQIRDVGSNRPFNIDGGVGRNRRAGFPVSVPITGPGGSKWNYRVRETI